MEKKSKENSISTILISVLVVALVVAILLLVTAAICISRFPEWREFTFSALGFLGSIIGGALTLVGVALTIGHSIRTRKEDLAIQYKPLLSARVLKTGKKSSDALAFEVNTLFNHSGYSDTNLSYNAPIIAIENSGRGEISSLRVKKTQCMFISAPEGLSHGEYSLNSSCLFGDKSITLTPGKTIDLIVGVPTAIHSENPHWREGYSARIEYEIDFSIVSPFRQEPYYYKMRFYLDINFPTSVSGSAIDSLDLSEI